MNTCHSTPQPGDAELRPIEQSLDALGQATRALPDANFEARIAQSTLPTAPRLLHPAHGEAVRPTARWASPRMSLAAAVALLVTVGAAYIANRSRTAGPEIATVSSAQQELSDYLLISAALDEAVTFETGTIATDAESLGKRVRESWGLGDETLNEGAM